MPQLRASILLSVGLGCVAILAAQAQTAPPQTPVFRGETNIFHIDVTVHDKNRHPVPGLTAADFTVIENGAPRKVVAVSEVDVRPPVATTAKWQRDVAADVSSNQLEGRRLVVLAIDFLTPLGRRAAHAMIDHLGPDDLAAVVFLRSDGGAQDFTADRRALSAVVDGQMPPVIHDECGTHPLRMLATLVEALEDVPDRRKSVFYFSDGMRLDFVPARDKGDRPGCQSVNLAVFADVMRHAQISNTNFYPVDVLGLRPAALPSGRTTPIPHDLSLDFLQILADNTGGRAIVKDNRPDLTVVQRMDDAASYYLVGYEMAPRPNEGELYRRIEIKVDRPGVEVISRTRYYEPAIKADDAAAASSPAEDAIAGLLPDRGMALRAAVTPFASETAGRSLVSIVLGVDRPSADSPTRDVLDVIVQAYDSNRKSHGRFTFTPVLEAGPGSSRYELSSGLELPPGKFEIRASVHNRTTGRTGSVYAPVDVPDFAIAPLSLSGAALDVRPGLTAIPLSRPTSAGNSTTLREFGKTDRVLATVQVYQGGKRALSPVTMLVRIVDDHDKVVLSTDETIAVERFGPRRSSPYRAIVPVSSLAPGEYLLTVSAKLDAKNVIQREVRFTVK